MPGIMESLAKAVVVNTVTKERVPCMFNPHEFTVVKQNQYDTEPLKGSNVPKITFAQGGEQNLSMTLFFDTYGENTDVRKHTDGLWRMMMVAEEKKDQTTNKAPPPHVEFRWGKFSFLAVIVSLTQKFIVFNKDGIPLRTTVDVSFKQIEDGKPALPNPTSGGGPPMKTRIVQAGDRLDLIANEVYDDPRYWRLIARENGILHPLRLREGQQLVIPPLG